MLTKEEIEYVQNKYQKAQDAAQAPKNGYSKKQIETLLREIQIKENLNSIRQVLEQYPLLNSAYQRACSNEMKR